MTNNNEKTEKKSGKIIIIFLGALLGIGLLIYGSYADSGGEASDNDRVQEKVSGEMDADAYAQSLEVGIARLCEGVQGVENVRVFVTLSGGYTAVYAQNSQSSASGYKNEFVLSGSGSSEKPLLVGYSVPQVNGVGIVCSGGGMASVRQELIALVSASLGISSNKIYVSEG